jgi:hypothetical protein
MRISALDPVPVLRSVEYTGYKNSRPDLVDFVHHDIGKSRHHPLKRTGIMADMAYERKRDE